MVFHYVQITTPLGTLEANEVVEGGKIDALWVTSSIPDAVGVSGTHCVLVDACCFLGFSQLRGNNFLSLPLIGAKSKAPPLLYTKPKTRI